MKPTPAEPKNNIIGVCPSCASELLSDFQKLPAPNYKIGDFVKTAFDCPIIKGKPAREHMWVQITLVDNDCVVGTLDNHPAFCTSAKYGDIVRVEKKNISQYIAK